jgi:hypothetical protein
MWESNFGTLELNGLTCVRMIYLWVRGLIYVDPSVPAAFEYGEKGVQAWDRNYLID